MAAPLGDGGSSTRAHGVGNYRLWLDLGNVGKPDDQFDGFRIDITVADTTFTETLLEGVTGNNLRGHQEIEFALDHDIVGDWLLTFDWLNALSDPARGTARQRVVYGYKLRLMKTSLFQVSFGVSDPVLTPYADLVTSCRAAGYWSIMPTARLARRCKRARFIPPTTP